MDLWRRRLHRARPIARRAPVHLLRGGGEPDLTARRRHRQVGCERSRPEVHGSVRRRPSLLGVGGLVRHGAGRRSVLRRAARSKIEDAGGAAQSSDNLEAASIGRAGRTGASRTAIGDPPSALAAAKAVVADRVAVVREQEARRGAMRDSNRDRHVAELQPALVVEGRAAQRRRVARWRRGSARADGGGSRHARRDDPGGSGPPAGGIVGRRDEEHGPTGYARTSSACFGDPPGHVNSNAMAPHAQEGR